MELFIGLAGALLLIIVVVDILQTTFYLTGAGFLSGRITQAIWYLLLKLHKRFKSHSFLEIFGSAIILIMFLIWGFLFWLSFVLIFNANDYSIVNSETNEPADFLTKVYFVGFSITTLGMGDYIPSNNFWRLITIFSSGLGFFFLTLIITYLIPLISSVVEKRKFAAFVNSIGNTPGKFLERLNNNRNFSELSDLLITFIPLINSMNQHHLTYPALHYFHTSQRKTASAPAIATLDEALSILASLGDDKYSELVIPGKRAIDDLLDTLNYSFLKMHEEVPPVPDINILNQLGIKANEKDFLEYFESISERRRMLRAYINHDGWDWEEVIT